MTTTTRPQEIIIGAAGTYIVNHDTNKVTNLEGGPEAQFHRDGPRGFGSSWQINIAATADLEPQEMPGLLDELEAAILRYVERLS